MLHHHGRVSSQSYRSRTRLLPIFAVSIHLPLRALLRYCNLTCAGISSLRASRRHVKQVSGCRCSWHKGTPSANNGTLSSRLRPPLVPHPPLKPPRHPPPALFRRHQRRRNNQQFLQPHPLHPSRHPLPPLFSPPLLRTRQRRRRRELLSNLHRRWRRR